MLSERESTMAFGGQFGPYLSSRVLEKNGAMEKANKPWWEYVDFKGKEETRKLVEAVCINKFDNRIIKKDNFCI